jgi:opacity protein-like surface antigen
LLSSLLVCSTLVLAQPLTDSSKALQFQIGNNFNLSSFQGSALSYKFHFQPEFALRIGIGLAGDDTGITDDRSLFGGDTLTSSSNQSDNRSGVNIEINAQSIWYANTSSEILFFYGGGPLVAYARRHQVDHDVTSPVVVPQATTISDRTSITWVVGLTGVAGVEWFVSQSLSLHAEYIVSGRYSWTSEETIATQSPSANRSTTDRSYSVWQLSGNGVRFGVSAYFQ